MSGKQEPGQRLGEGNKDPHRMDSKMFQNLARKMSELLNILRAQVAAQELVVRVVQEVHIATPATQEDQATSAIYPRVEPIVVVSIQTDPAVYMECHGRKGNKSYVPKPLYR
ncbi:hypothetical protein Syun_029786 [Stephania yunnanensis]|uniref:Uncharacterized protein n=1 Tax=Stephania yunnanensis TaxID=152371 RepID=A0AAP0EAQ8_9MAGN